VLLLIPTLIILVGKIIPISNGEIKAKTQIMEQLRIYLRKKTQRMKLRIYLKVL
jgi:hypothetical protein